MTDGPPDWMEAPPSDEGNYGSPAVRGQGGARRGGGNRPADMTPDEVSAAVADFMGWLTTRETRTELETVLPDHVDVDVFIATAKTAVLNKPSLLRADLRASLLVAVQRAAGQGLMPDGKQGALVPRYDTEARKYAVAWQPMVWGVTKLGRETGAIQSIRACIVFHGEPFRIVQGDEDRIEHEVMPDVVDEAYAALNAGRDQHGNPKAHPTEFFARVRAAYCVITPVVGLPTKRWMTKQRLVSLWESSKASNGPWNSRWIDEMILKGMILLTTKWINLDTASAPARRFQAALMTDMEIDFDREREELPAPTPLVALPSPEMKLGTLEDMLGREKEKVPVGAGNVIAADLPLAAVPGGEGAQGGASQSPPANPSDGEGGAEHPVRPAREPSEGRGEAGASAAPTEPVPVQGSPTPEEDQLAKRVHAALGAIKAQPAESVAKMAGGAKYATFIKELEAAHRLDLLTALRHAVAAKGGAL